MKLIKASLICSCFCTAACSINPATNLPRILALSERQQEKVGNASTQAALKEYGMYHHTSCQSVIDHIGQNLALIAPGPRFKYRYYILDWEEPQAFALPGGAVFISRGILPLFQTEDQLANVLAHEVSHVAIEHTAARMTYSYPIDVIVKLLTLPLTVVNQTKSEAIQSVLHKFMISPYSKQQEREADRLGVSLSASLGYDPKELGSFLKQLALFKQGHTSNSTHHYLATHPHPAERADLIDIYAEVLDRGPKTALFSNNFMEQLNGLIVGPNPAKGFWYNNSYIWLEKNIQVNFPPHWLFQKNDQQALAISTHGNATFTLETKGNHFELDTIIDELKSENQLATFNKLPQMHSFIVYHGLLIDPNNPNDSTHVWLWTHNKHVFQLMGYWNSTYDDELSAFAETIISSTKDISKKERASISVLKLHIYTVQQAQSLRQIHKQLQSPWPLSKTAIINAIDADQILDVGRKIKVVSRTYLTPN